MFYVLFHAVDNEFHVVNVGTYQLCKAIKEHYESRGKVYPIIGLGRL